jgi:hypothetical protein
VEEKWLGCRSLFVAAGLFPVNVWLEVQFTVEDVIEMSDEYCQQKRPIQRPRFYRKRMTPKTRPPQTPKTLWYVDPDGVRPKNSD